jgi:hemin uptake protein HemP
MASTRPATTPPVGVPPAQPSAVQGPALTLGQARGGKPLRRVHSAVLLGPDQEVEIEHGQAVYRLRLTSLGKLILTK